jgi:type I restriction enzyme S subunit
MASEWREVHFGEIADTLPGKYIPALEYDSEGKYLIYGSNSIMGRAREPLCDGPIIIFARIGSNCGATMFSSAPCWINNNAAGIRGKPGTDTRFLFYWMRSFDFSLIREGSGQPFISQATLDSQVLRLPPLPEQRAIAHILGTLDEKIELNRRMSETLEAMARALFKSWFVDFDPVRAKAEGRDPGLPKHIADLFPDSLEDSDLGEIPKGWKVVPLKDAFEIVSGRTLPKSARDDSGPYQVFGANGPIARTREAWVDSQCIVLGKIGTCGSLHRSPGPCWVTNNAFAVRAGRSQSIEFAWQTLRSVDFSSYIGGSANPYMPLKSFGHHRIVLPPPLLLDRFQSVAGDLGSRIESGNLQSCSLAALRNTILPKLISGELRVKDAEWFLSGVE